MKNLTLTLCAIALSFISFSQDGIETEISFDKLRSITNDAEVVADVDTAWAEGGLLGLNASQTFLDNWAGGGQNSVSGTAYLNLFKNYASGDWVWNNNLDLSYGLLNNGIVEGKTVKIDDKIDFRSRVGKAAFDHWYYTANLNFLTQFAPGYTVLDGAPTSDKISDLLAPAFLSAGVGMTYQPNENFSLTIAPISTKNTIVNGANSNLRANYGFTDLGSSIRSEFGGTLGLNYKRDLAENAQYQTNLLLFSNYANNPGNVDVNWENIIAMKLAKYFNVNFIVQLVYDDDIKLVNQKLNTEGELVNTKSTLQLRQVFGVGFSYKF